MNEKEKITIEMRELKNSWVQSTALDSNMEIIPDIQHTSSNVEWAKHDMLEFKKRRYDELYPNGWEIKEYKFTKCKEETS